VSHEKEKDAESIRQLQQRHWPTIVQVLHSYTRSLRPHTLVADHCQGPAAQCALQLMI
jgi:hypothetical protein